MSDSREDYLVDPFQDMRETEGWKNLKDYINQRKEEYKSKILKCDPYDVVEVSKFQSKIYALDLILNKVK